MSDPNSGVNGQESMPTENPAVNPEQETAQEQVAPEQVQNQGQGRDDQNPTNSGDAQTDEFPEGQDKQREAFIAMRQEIKELKQQISGGRPSDSEESAVPELDLINLSRGVSDTPVSTPKDDTDQFADDPATKEFLNRTQQAREEAARARHEAARAAAQLEDFEAWQQFPELNPKSKEADKAFISDVSNAYTAARLQAMNAGKQPPRLVEIANKVNERYEQIRSQAREQGQQEAQKTIEQKATAQLESKGTSLPVAPQNDRIEELRARVRRGDINAQVELNKLVDPFLANWE